jgi:hypothetical protein
MKSIGRVHLYLSSRQWWRSRALLLAITLCTSVGALAAEPKRVLLLHSFGREFAPYDVIVASFARNW